LSEIVQGKLPYGAETAWRSGFADNQDWLIPSFDSQFPEKTLWSGDETTGKAVGHSPNRLADTEAYKSTWDVIDKFHQQYSNSRYTGGTWGKQALGKPFGVDEKIAAKEAFTAQIKALDANLPTLQSSLVKLRRTPPTYDELKAKAAGEIAPVEAKSGLPENAPLMGEVQTTIGTKDVTQEYTAEEKKDRLKSFLMERYKDSEGRNYIPSGFDAMYQALHPESQFKVFQTEIGPMYWDGNSIKPAPKQVAVTMKQIRESKRGMFGNQTEKGWIPEEVGQGTGVYLAGLFNRSDADLTKFDEMAVNNASGLQALRGIKEILKMPLHSIPIGEKRAKAFGRVQVYIAALKAAIRTDIVGVGTVSNFEQTMIKLAVPDPSELWRLDDADKGRIDELEKRLKSQLVNTGSMKGVSVMFSEPSSEKDIESSLRSGNKKLK
jgi:hypothetical protein